MEKRALVAAVLEQLERELVHARAAAQAAREAATAEENRPENEYDTRALEASFLARGQANRVAELEHAIHVLREFPLRSFTDRDKIQAGALVCVTCDGVEHLHLILPSGAGLQIASAGLKISVVTTTSPLGIELLGKGVGDQFFFKRGGLSREFEILSVS